MRCPRFGRSVSLVTLVLVAGCSLVTRFSRLTSEERDTIDYWLFCEECTDGELDSVLSLASRKPSATTDTLVNDLLQGPSATRRDNLRMQLAKSYSRLADYTGQRGGPSVPLDQAAYVTLFLGTPSACPANAQHLRSRGSAVRKPIVR